MNEQFSHQENTEESFDTLKEAALDVGLVAKLPTKGTPAYTRLLGLCKKYSDAVQRDMSDRTSSILSGKERREYHNELCKMIFGTDYDATSGDKIKTISNFAHIVSGREQFVD